MANNRALSYNINKTAFEWDENKLKHGVSFYEAQNAFFDANRLIAEDLEHSIADP